MTIKAKQDVMVITGLGKLGLAIAGKLAGDCKLVLAESDQSFLTAATEQLRAEKHEVIPVLINFSDFDAVKRLAAQIQTLGNFRAVIFTQSKFPPEATMEKTIAENILGSAYILDAFGKIAEPGSIAICIAGIAGNIIQLSKKDEKALVNTRTSKLKTLKILKSEKLDKDFAYGLTNRFIQIRTEAASIDWGFRGGRTVSISPGVTAIDQLDQELGGLTEEVRKLISDSGANRLGDLEKIVSVVEFLIGEDASFITGTDLRVDGGLVSALRPTGI